MEKHMNQKTKTLLSILIFAVFIIAVYFIYINISADYKPPVETKNGESVTADSGQTEDERAETDKAPDFTVFDADGNEVKLSDFFGKPIVLNFWASWCPPCKSEMPHFNEVYGDVKGDITFIMIDLVDGQRETLKDGQKFIEESGYSFPVYFDTEQQAAYTYGISSIPTTIFIDKDGKIVKGYTGAIDKETLLSNIDSITK